MHTNSCSKERLMARQRQRRETRETSFAIFETPETTNLVMLPTGPGDSYTGSLTISAKWTELRRRCRLPALHRWSPLPSSWLSCAKTSTGSTCTAVVSSKAHSWISCWLPSWTGPSLTRKQLLQSGSMSATATAKSASISMSLGCSLHHHQQHQQQCLQPKATTSLRAAKWHHSLRRCYSTWVNLRL